jgi:hypothetical protein
MRVPKSWVPLLAKRIVDNLIQKKLIDASALPKNLVEVTERLITEELTVEDRLNEEVRQLLKKYESDIEKGHLDYRKLFDMTKQKLIRDRNIVL